MRPFSNFKNNRDFKLLLLPIKLLLSCFVVRPAMCRNRKQLSSQSPQQLTAGQMGGCQSPGFELLWHSFLCPLPPATAPTANQSPVRSFKVLAKLLTEQSLKDECPCLLGRSKIARTLLSPPTPGIYSLEEQPCPADELPEAFERANCTGALIISKWGNGQGGLCRSTSWHDLHIDGKGEDGESNSVSRGKSPARTVSSSSYDFSTWLLTLMEQLVNIKLYTMLTSMNEYRLNTMIILF